MAFSFKNTSPADTYKSILHASGNELPISGVVPIYDGDGSKSAVLIGREGQGIYCQGLSASDLTVSDLLYPPGYGERFGVVFQTTNGSNGTAQLGLSSISQILKISGVGVTFNSYVSLSSNRIPFLRAENGIVTEIASKEITTITESAGGTSRLGAPDEGSPQYVVDIDTKGGLITKVYYGNLLTSSAIVRSQVRTFFFDLRLDPDVPFSKSTKAGRYYESSAVDAYVNSVWNLEHSTAPITGDCAIIIATRTGNTTKAVAAENGVVSITVTETGMKAWGYRWTGSEWELLGTREIEPGDDPTSWLVDSAPVVGETNWPTS